jgi:hypothetical protein
VQNPENKLTLTMLGAFSEFERAKIIERTTRGRLHRLRGLGFMSGWSPNLFCSARGGSWPIVAQSV